MNFARLNHILIPKGADERIAMLKTGPGRLMGALFAGYLRLTGFGRALAVFWLFASLMAMNIAYSVCYIVWSILTALMISCGIASLFYRPKGLRVHATCAPRVVVDGPFEVMVHLHNEGDTPLQGVVTQSPFLPYDGTYRQQPAGIAHLEPGQTRVVNARAVFSERGAHSLMPFNVGIVVPFGIITGRPLSSNITRFIVLPRVADVKTLTLETAPRFQPGGVAMASLVGEARELVGVRQYRSGDPIRDVHARTWARTGIPHVKEYHQEFFTRVGVILDVDAKAGRRGARHFEAAISLCAGVMRHLAHIDAIIDILALGSTLHHLTIGRSLGFLEQGLDLLAQVEPGQPINVPQLQRRVAPHMDILSSVVFICLGANAAHLEMVNWMTGKGIPVKRLMITDESNSDQRAVQRAVTTVTPAAIGDGAPLFL